MPGLEKRVAQLECARVNANIKTMTDDELRAFTGTLENGSSRWWDCVMASVMRHNSAFQVIHDDPDHAGGEHEQP